MAKDNELDELLELAEETLDNPTEELNQTEQFINEVGIKESEDKFVMSQVIYFRYEEWCKEKSLEPRHRIPFFKEFKAHFFMQHRSGFKVYKVEQDPFDMSREYYLRNRERQRKEEYKRQVRASKSKFAKPRGTPRKDNGQQEKNTKK